MTGAITLLNRAAMAVHATYLSRFFRFGTVGIALLLPSAYMAWSWRDMPQLGQGHDDSIYWVSAGSLAQGGGYRIASFPEHLWQTKYPPLLPLFLSFVWRISPRFPANLPVATLFCWLWFPLWLALAYRLLRDLDLGRAAALGLCVVLAVNVEAVHFGMSTHAEMMFSALWMTSAALALRTGASVRTAVLAGIIGGAAYLTKTAGLPLLLAAPLYFVVQKQYYAAAAFAAGMLPAVVGWNLWMHSHLVPSTDGLTIYYTDYFRYHLYNIGLRDLPALFAKNLDALLSSLGSLFFGLWSDVASETPIAIVALHALGILTIVGTVRHIKRIGLTPHHLFTGGYVVLLLIWHYPPNERFLFPLTPVLLAGCWTGIRDLGAMFKRRRGALRVALATCLGTFALALGVLGWAHFYNWLGGLRQMRVASSPVYEWIERNTPVEAEFLATDDALLYLYTGRTACRPVVPTRYFYRDDRGGVRRFVGSLAPFARQHHLAYVVAGPRDWRGELLPSGLAAESHQMLAADRELHVLFQSKDTTVYGFD